MAQTIGEQLKQARLKRGLSLEEASQATHIRPHYLEALENDQRDALPSSVQGRGFLRLYAGLLELPVADLLATWEGKIPIEQTPPPMVGSAPQDSSTGQGSLVVTDGSSEAHTEAEAVLEPTEPTPVEQESGAASSGADAEDADVAGGSQAVFHEIGQILRKQREGLGLSTVEVERYTRLRQFYVQALEEGRMDQLPSPVQGRGMLSNYAAFLNLDEEKLLLRFAEGLQIRRIERIPKPEPAMFNSKKRPARQAPLWRRFLTPDLIFGVGVAAIILFFVVWTAARINNLRSTKTQPTPPGISEILLTPLADLTTTGTPGTGTPKLPTNVAGESASSGETLTPSPSGPAPIGETATAQPPAAETKSAGAAAGTPILPGITETIAPINKDPLQVYIIARQRAYLRIVTDDKIKFLGRTVPGNAYAFSGSKRIELITGNGAALQVFYNQNDLGALGTEGQVVGLVFSQEGMATPTAAFTPTATPTKPGTATPLPTATPLASPTITPLIPTKGP